MLYFVSTPVGNLKDISLRALEVLRAVDLIACEDTRTSLKLLSRYEIRKPLVAYHKFNERTEGEKLIALLEEGKEIALITDAGMTEFHGVPTHTCLAIEPAFPQDIDPITGELPLF